MYFAYFHTHPFYHPLNPPKPSHSTLRLHFPPLSPLYITQLVAGACADVWSTYEGSHHYKHLTFLLPEAIKQLLLLS